MSIKKVSDIYKNVCAGIIILFLGWITIKVTQTAEDMAVFKSKLTVDIEYIKGDISELNGKVAIIEKKINNL